VDPRNLPNRIRAVLGRCLTYGVPFCAAMISIGVIIPLELYSRRGGPLPLGTSPVPLLFLLIVNAALAAFGAAGGAILLPGRTAGRVAGSVLYGVVGLLAYLVLCYAAAELFL
jgi:hypothetical protein